MSSSAVSPVRGASVARPIVTAQTATIMLLVVSAFLALVVYYFIGLDEGATSVFGKTMIVHEFFHDGRHFLGFPCH
jgi:cobalt transporter subunit CbtB